MFFIVDVSKRNSTIYMRGKNGERMNVGNYLLLGSGTFSDVLKFDGIEDDNVFVKMPKSDRGTKALHDEVKVLKDLGGHVCIPELYDPADPIKVLDIRIRCESAHRPCLPLRGIIGRAMSFDLKWSSDTLKFIFEDVYDALEYAHAKGWAHMDIQPSNIIIRVDPYTCRLTVMLADWGCAQRKDTELFGFVGCSEYAHDELFGITKAWMPRLDHDLASLVYTVASLSHGSIPWLSLFQDRHAVVDNDKKERLEKATEAFMPLHKTLELSPEVKGAFLSAIGYQEEKP